MKYFRKFRRGRNIRKRGVSKRYGKRTVSKSVRRYVKNAIHRQIENKEIITYAANQSCTQGLSGSTNPAFIHLIPRIGNGTAAYQRTGNAVKIVKGRITGHINLLPYSATFNPLSTPICVRMIMLKSLKLSGQKDSASGGYPGWAEYLFSGNGAKIGLQGNMLDMHLPVDRDEFRVLSDRKFKLGAASATSSGQVGTGGYFDNSPMTKYFSYNWGKYVRKQLKFQDNNVDSNLCQNDNLYLVFLVVNADGTSTALTPCEYHYTNVVQYEDA